MGLINLQTDLKSLKFGNDRVNGGNSKQPYIQTPIPERTGEFGFLNQDFILRGGSKAVTDSALDVVRLGKYFTDLRSPSGLLFIAKQNLLSRTAVRTQASGLILNEGAYTPLSTLIEAGGVAFGLHVNKQGLNPFGGVGGINTYSDIMKVENIVFTSAPTLYNNRLVKLNDSTISGIPVVLPSGEILNLGKTNVLTYTGGPGSILGIGSTNIKFADQRTGLNNPLRVSDPIRFYGQEKYSSTEYFTLAGEYKPIPTDPYENLKRFLGLSIYPSIYDGYLRPSEEDNIIPSIISPNVEITTDLKKDEYNTYTQKQLIDIPGPNEEGIEYNGQSFYIGKGGVTTPGDFRTLLRNKQTPFQKDIETPQFGSLIDAPIYTEKNIEQRVNLGDPGSRTGKNLTSYTNGAYKGAASISGNGSYDKINRSPIVLTNGLNSDTTFDGEKNDLVKFAISVLDTKQNRVASLHFRAFLNNISDQYDADWNPTQYIGRGEKFYTYGGFNRKVSLSWTVAAQSKIELIPMYKKLNYLASVCAPNYSENGYMQGNIVKLTVGGYFFQQPGIITGFNYEMNDDNATWEIGINDEGEYDSTVKELPHLIKVSGFNFIPIHTFVPRLVQNPNTGTKERYIALQAGTSNYDVADE